jgi:DNA-directed RNA polymerase specialized sigma24 family protein
MKKDWVLTQESFDAMLAWLHPDRDRAGEKYEDIRSRLVKIFTGRGCCEPEELADETINRVSKKLKDIESQFIGDPARYFYGVANKVHLEYLRKKPVPLVPVDRADSDFIEKESACLEICMQGLTSDNRELVVQYYQYEKRAMIDHRQHLADQLGIAINALRIRACRLRAILQKCVQDCLERSVA